MSRIFIITIYKGRVSGGVKSESENYISVWGMQAEELQYYEE
jgi:hypothetical protein